MEQSNETPKKFSFSKVIKLTTPSSTPKINKSINFAASLRKKNAFYLLPEANYNTPSPSSSNRVVKNPFEQHLADRLHLPVISSPSLFQHPQTPKHSNDPDDFEWTIDDVSELKPANFHPHETQFKENIDPELEAKAQAAITTFFSEQHIVPSPHDCQLRKQKIFLQDDSFTSLMIVNSTALSNKKKSPFKEDCIQRRNNFAQTTLTFPPDLPKEVEDVLKKYSIFNEDQQQNVNHDHSMSDTDKSNQFMDISTLRRKLFGAKHVSQEVDSDGPESPIINRNNLASSLSTPTRSPDLGLPEIKANVNDSLCSELFGELSPISNNTTPSAKKQKNNDMSIELDNSEEDLMLSQSFEKEKDNDFDISSEQTTPSRKSRTSRKGKLRGKNLSTSFCLLQSEFDEESRVNDKENLFVSKKTTIFRRMDSGFNDESSSNLSMMEHFEPIDENKESLYYYKQMPAIKEPLKVLGNRVTLKSRNSSFCDNHDLSFDVSMQSETDFMCSTQKN